MGGRAFVTVARAGVATGSRASSHLPIPSVDVVDACTRSLPLPRAQGKILRASRDTIR